MIVPHWERAAKIDNISFAYIKASEGAGLKDRRFRENWNGTADAGIAHGAYHLYSPQREPESQVKNFVEAVNLVI